ncbi:hypothetical protein BaRGS_00017082 [Batillaria attramentaria]|uniref:Cytochrome c oxidase polypeptide II n=1 Tax=Batillaria attramentaria TaxID=370345 RepID=A0ABD0KWW2_9CAEN
MAHHYNLRSTSKERRHARELDDQGFTEDPAHAESSDSDEMDKSYVFPDASASNSDLSTTASDSFSFHSRLSPGPRGKHARLYPCLPDTSDSSPRGSKRHKRNLPVTPGLDRSFESQSSDQNNTSAEMKHESMSHVVVMFIMVLVFIPVIAVFFSHHLSAPEISYDAPSDKFTQFSTGIEKLSTEFPGQHKNLWRTVRSCVKHVLESDYPSYPGVLLLASHNNNAAVTAKIARKIAEKFQAAAQAQSDKSLVKHDLSYNVSGELSGLEAEKQKEILDGWLHKQLVSKGSAVVLHHLELLVPDAALLLHGYCDGDNAPYKNVLIILVLYLDRIPDSGRDTETVLSEQWSGKLPEDKVRALLSRVANNIGVVL